MSLELKAKTYDWKYLIGLPFACNPLCTIGVVGQKILTGVVNVVWVLVEARFIDLAIACAMGQALLSDAYPILAAMLFIIFWKRIGYSFGRILTAKIEISSAYQIKKETVKKRSRLLYHLIENTATWELCRRISKDMEENIWNMLQNFCNFLIGVIRISGVFFIIFTESKWMGILMLFVSVPVISFSIYSGKKTYQAFYDASVFARRGEYFQTAMLGRDCAEERTLYHYTDYLDMEWNRQQEQFRKISMRAEIGKEKRNLSSGMLTNLISAVMVCFLTAELSRGRLSIGIFIALSKAIYDMIGLMHNEIGQSVIRLSNYTAYMKDLTAFVNLEETKGSNDLPAEEKQEFESLELMHVSFHYPGMENYILKDISMRLEKGGHYAFVGENGAGKTTLTKLLTGLYQNYEGNILLNGKELKQYEPAVLKAMFSNVWQDFARYQDSIANNILIGDIRHMEEKEARKRMEVYVRELAFEDEIQNMSQGFDTQLGRLFDGGADLSGGQWQRVAMARSLMNPAPVQILDEPTAALDPVSESRLYEEFEKISRGRTTLFISHRLGSTKLAEKIFVIKDGKVAEEGGHKDLMDQNGLYARMYQSQKSWYQDTIQKGGSYEEA